MMPQIIAVTTVVAPAFQPQAGPDGGAVRMALPDRLAGFVRGADPEGKGDEEDQPPEDEKDDDTGDPTHSPGSV